MVPYNLLRRYLPTGLFTCDVSVELSGNQLINMLSLDPAIFFIKASNGKCIDVNKNLLSTYKNDINDSQDIKNYIIAEFIHGFYKFMKEKATYIDLISDSFNYQSFISKSKKQSPVMLNMRNPYFSINLNGFGKKELEELSKEYRKNNVDKTFTIYNTTIEIGLTTPFSVFSELFEILPYEKFSSISSLKIPASDSLDSINIPETPSELKEKFNSRFKGRLMSIFESISKEYGNNASYIKQLELTQNYIPYSFMITISFKDIDTYFMDYLESESNDVVVIQTQEILKKIVSYIVYMSNNL